MPSIEESKRKVKTELSHAPEIDHDAILASLQDEIDRHNSGGSTSRSKHHRRRRDSSRESSREDKSRSMRFRFKSHRSEHDRDSKKRKRRSRDDKGHRHRRRTKDHDSSQDNGEENEQGAAHPFPREPTHPDVDGKVDPNAAFRDSLFDALADDEGAAYWESVYSQPIHVYQRPTVKTPKGELEEMNDDQYAAYVQTKMWEKKNPEIVIERERAAKQRKEEEEERTRQREEFIRRKERAAWDRAQRAGAKRFAGEGDGAKDGYEYVFDFSDRDTGRSKRSEPELNEYVEAWSRYNIAWDRLKLELLDEANSGPKDEKRQTPSKRIPWPVLQHKPVTRPNIEAFMRHIPLESDGKSRLQLLKAERFKWHPDKMQQRFVGSVDEGTMKVVTGVFQVVDALVEEERKREGTSDIAPRTYTKQHNSGDMGDFNRQDQDTLLPSLPPQTNTGDNRRDSSDPAQATQPTQPTQPSAIGTSAPPSNKTIPPSTDIQGLREQIFSNAAVLFPKATIPYQLGQCKPHDIFDIIVLRRAQRPATATASAQPEITYGWRACLVYGPLGSRSAAAYGLCRASVEGALQALLEFLAEKTVHGRQFKMEGLKFENGSGLVPSLLGPQDKFPGVGEERKRPRSE
ncbi:hypothetical protein PRZ48_006174 [Zasmidium cellare]|uniref:Uncharacterized protein n=1 Tax=Zasmidium cellare TaxID=395010 RepID=A0ABR0EPL4_ZASCE|nr:hypothetical protein PRZ48_006174 [Zasmidium cellare]